ncbi:SOS response-associated peptidase [Ulvibacterium sp.]|uniref:SOS response-associated peptidase n=1 Tax=Ulvibacterium sp. TaxID=2665914 RepID=UPI003BA8BAD7
MYFKLSNIAKREQMERLFEVSFKHPNLYRPEVVINGLNESNLPVITSLEPHTISLAIWGLLPKGYHEDWSIFQNSSNTLNIDESQLDSDLWFVSAFEQRRCLILVTGFFTSYLRNGEVYPYYVGLKSEAPFFLAGIYNVLDDGFITCSLLVGKANEYVKRFQNVVDHMPIIIGQSKADQWLDRDTPLEQAKSLVRAPQKFNLRANPIAKEFFNRNISYDSMLEPYDYPDLPDP